MFRHSSLYRLYISQRKEGNPTLKKNTNIICNLLVVDHIFKNINITRLLSNASIPATRRQCNLSKCLSSL